MKIRVTLLTENNRPVSALGQNPTENARRGWELVCALLNSASGVNKDHVALEALEIVEEAEQ
jgi:hypothetical protein